MKTVKKILAKDTYKIRKEVLRKNIDLPFKFNGDFDQNTFHLGVFVNNQLSGVASFMKSDVSIKDKTTFQLRGMATKNEFRGKGLGSLLILEAEKVLKPLEVDVISVSYTHLTLPTTSRV